MRHFSCDLCGKTLTPAADRRYVVRVEGFAAADAGDAADDFGHDDPDPIDATSELMDHIASGECDDPADAPPANARREYDLCPGCYVKLLADPLGLTARANPQYSAN